MEETEILARLDDRGRAAAAAVHTAVADRPVPAFDPTVHRVAIDVPPGRPWVRRWAPLLGVAAALLLVLGAVAVLGLPGDGDSAPADRTGTVGPPRRWAPAEVPADLRVTSLSQGPSEAPTLGGPVLLFGPDADEVELAVAVISAPAPDPADGDPLEGLDRVDLGDREGGRLDGLGYGRSGILVVVDGRQVLVGGRDRDVVTAVATTIGVAGDRPVIDDAALPDDWSAQGELGDLAAVASPIALARGDSSGTGWSVFFTDGATRLLGVTSSVGDDIDVRAVRALAGDARSVEVRGHDAVLATSPPPADAPEIGESIAVVWVERPGEVLRVAGSGLTEAEVLAAAESLSVASDATWAELGRASLQPDLAGGDVLLGEGTFSDGSGWALIVEPDGPATPDGEPLPDGEDGPVVGVYATLRTTADGGGGSSSTSDAPSGPVGFDGYSSSRSDTIAWAYGLVGEQVATVELVGPGGEVLATAEVLSAGGHHGWVLEVPLELSGLEEQGDGGSSSSSSSSGGGTATDSGSSSGSGPSTSVAGGGGTETTVPDGAPPDPDLTYLVARSADGTEVGRQQLG